jgi:hypothetical protein
MDFALKTNKTSMDSERKVFHSQNTNNPSTLTPSFRQNKKVFFLLISKNATWATYLHTE